MKELWDFYREMLCDCDGFGMKVFVTGLTLWLVPPLLVAEFADWLEGK